MPDFRPWWILPIIVFSQFAGTSLWFAGNAILPDLRDEFALSESFVGFLTSSVQLGFIIGTLLFAFLTIADRFSPVKVFFTCSLLGALANLAIYYFGHHIYSILAFRLLTGFFLAGIYPVGMKIAADWYEKGLGQALGFLVGALVLGTAFPHLIRDFLYDLPWEHVLFFTSGLSVLGGLILFLLVPDGPFRKKSSSPDLTAFFKVFKIRAFRSAALGYFGHMWELYTFWAFIPVILTYYSDYHGIRDLNIYLLTFLIIGVGSISCAVGGFISKKAGSEKVAFYALLGSGICCLFFPIIFFLSPHIFFPFLVVWGILVIADSPQFSSLIAKTAEHTLKGTALTIVNCIGFSITIVSIQITTYFIKITSSHLPLIALVFGPILGLIALYPISIKKREHAFTK